MTSCKYIFRPGMHKRLFSIILKNTHRQRSASQYSNVYNTPIVAITNLSYFQRKTICTTKILLKKARVNVTFCKHDGQQFTGVVKEGETLLDAVVNNDLDLKGYGACEGTLSCSTCHVIFKPEDFGKLKENPSDEELDMLDLALEVSPTSRLGCQVTVTKDMEGLKVQVPAVARDARENPIGTDSAST